MLSIGKVSTASAGVAYYETEGYYSSPKDHNSEWFGKGAQELGLYGNVNPETFKSILEGKIPNSSQKLGRMVKGDFQHSPGIDLTFSAPKSFSILAETNNDNILHRLHQMAVKKTLVFVEQRILETRIYTDKSQTNYNKQKMVAALFRHDTNRNLDPQTHTHAVIANMVQGEDKKWRSYDNGSLYDNKLLIGAIYRSNLAQNLNRLGIEVETTHSDGRFELSHVPQELIDIFSSRSKEIKAKIKEYGVSNPKTIDKIALSTRKNKSKDVDRQALRSEWRNKISELGYSIKHLTLHYSRKFISPNKTREAAQQAVSFATSHLSERSAVFKEQDLKIQALGHASGKATITDIEKAYQNSLENGQLLKRKISTTRKFNYLTTPKMVKLEKNIVTEHDKGKNNVNQILPAFIADKYLKNTHLNQGQRDAILLSLTSINRTVAIQGNAGTGKTTLLKQVKALAETADKHIIGLAPSGSAANTLAKETGIPSQTLSSFLKKYDGVIHDRLTDKGRKSLQEEFKNIIIILDESSFASSEQMYGLLKIVNEVKSPRLILAGDLKQLEAVDAGKPFHFLQKNNMSTAYVTDIVRQKNAVLKEAIESSLTSDISSAFKKLDSSISQYEDQNLAQVTAERWLKLSSHEQFKTGIIAPTHVLVDQINEIIHEHKKESGELGQNTFTTETLKSSQLTSAQKGRAASYQEGQKVLFNHKYKSLGIKKGEILTVAKVDHKNVTVYLEGKSGFIKWMPSRVAGKRNGAIEVFNSKDIEMNEGEQIRWTRNNAKRGITNNEMGEILKITDKAILIKSETGLTQSFGKNDPQLKYLNYAYSSTTHAAQGKTLNKLIAVMESGRPALTNNKSFYVTISRPKYQVELITDNVQKLQETIERHTGESISALDHSKEASPEEKTQSPSKEHEVTSKKHLNNETEKQQEPEMKINREIELTM